MTYYTKTFDVTPGNRIGSQAVEDELALVQQGFASVATDLGTEIADRSAADALKAPLSSPVFTGTPVAPTAPAGTNTTQLATTAFVVATALDANLPGQLGNGGKFITSNGTSASWGPAANGIVAVVTVTGTWTAPAGVSRAKITVQAGGGSGATSTSALSRGGAGGGVAVKWATVVPGQTYTVTVGAGGIGDGALTTTAQAAGGTSSFAGSGFSTVSATGGAAAPGVGSGGDLNIPGGMFPCAVPSQNSFLGGASMFSGSANTSANASGYGGGGGGAAQNAAGTNGAPGVVIIEY